MLIEISEPPWSSAPVDEAAGGVAKRTDGGVGDGTGLSAELLHARTARRDRMPTADFSRSLPVPAQLLERATAVLLRAAIQESAAKRPSATGQPSSGGSVPSLIRFPANLSTDLSLMGTGWGINSLSPNHPAGRYAPPRPLAPASSRCPACFECRRWHSEWSPICCPWRQRFQHT